MEKERKGEIAYILVKSKLAKDFLPLNKLDFWKDINEISLATGASHKELGEFFRGLLLELVKETFE